MRISTTCRRHVTRSDGGQAPADDSHRPAITLDPIHPELRAGVEARPTAPLNNARHALSLRPPPPARSTRKPFHSLNLDPLWELTHLACSCRSGEEEGTQSGAGNPPASPGRGVAI